jgi:restriction endonuclease S subunit
VSFPSHKHYQNIEVAGMPPLPGHWRPGLLKRWITVRSGDIISSAEETQEGFPLIGGNGVRAYTAKHNTAANTLVIGRVGAKCGCVHHVMEDFWASEHAFRVVEKREVKKRFFFHLLTAIDLNRFAIKTAQPLLNTEIVETQWVGVPPLEEQELVASFLDRETAKIDALIAEQQRLIELLQEKRQAVISHAVTKGLNPNAPMKDSGVEWLGEVPERWGTTRLKHLAESIVDCPHETPTYNEQGEFLVIRTADLDSGNLEESNMRRVVASEYENRTRRAALEKDDIVYAREGERWGHAALVPCSEKFCLGQRMMQFRCGPGWEPRFLMWLLNSRPIYLQGSLDTVGATSPHVNVGTIRNYALPDPPQEEQELVSDYLDQHAAQYDLLVSRCRQSISLLGERRSALISAAVTGQIDVRGLVEAEAVEQ